jgi:hypothetical protein
MQIQPPISRNRKLTHYPPPSPLAESRRNLLE